MRPIVTRTTPNENRPPSHVIETASGCGKPLVVAGGGIDGLVDEGEDSADTAVTDIDLRIDSGQPPDGFHLVADLVLREWLDFALFGHIGTFQVWLGDGAVLAWPSQANVCPARSSARCCRISGVQTLARRVAIILSSVHQVVEILRERSSLPTRRRRWI